LGSAAGGEVAGGQGDEEQQGSNGGEGKRIVGGDAEELIGHEAREAKSGGETNGNAEEGHFCAVAEDELEDIARLRA